MSALGSPGEVPADALVIGLGGNLGGEAAIRERFERARQALAQLGDVDSARLYRTAPIGPSQPSYLNTAVRVRVRDASAPELLATVLEIERLLGRDRRRAVRWGPRTIDLDLLLWGARVVATPDLELPHPRIAERRFVLQPLVDLFGEQLVLPGQRASLGELERGVRAQLLEPIAERW